MTDIVKEKQCPICKYPHNVLDSDYCHDCGYNFEQYSNNDASDGWFEPQKNLCDHCRGRGRIPEYPNGYFGAYYVETCPKCKGTGKANGFDDLDANREEK